VIVLNSIIVVTYIADILISIVLKILVLSTTKLASLIASSGRKNVCNRGQVSTKSYFLSVWKKYTKLPTLSKDISSKFGKSFLNTNHELWKTINGIFWHFYSTFYKKYCSMPQLSDWQIGCFCMVALNIELLTSFHRNISDFMKN
jgi:hypothetical protein